MPKTLDLPLIVRAAQVIVEEGGEEDRIAEVVWSTGSRRTVSSWFSDDYEEELELDAGAVRLERLNAGAPLLNSHRAYDLDRVIGVVVEGSAKIERGQGTAQVRFSNRPEVDPIWQDVKDGILRNLSVGYKVHEYHIEKREGQMELWRAVDWEPMEISVVAIGADSGAQFRSDQEQKGATFPCIVRRSDASPETARAAKEQVMHPKIADEVAQEQRGATPPATTPPGAPATPPAPEQRAAAPVNADEIRSQERSRISQITTLCARHGIAQSVADHLITDGASLDAARSAILDALAGESDQNGRRSEPIAATARGTDQRAMQYREAMTTAIMHKLDPRTELTDEAREFRGMRLFDMARESVERSGVSTRGMHTMDIAAHALGLRAGVGYHSTSDFPTILGNVANRTLRSAYAAFPKTFEKWARRGTISDFRPITRVAVSGAPELKKVLEGAEFTYGTMGATAEVIQLATYGRIIAITRQALINDDMDALSRIPAAFGARAAQLEGDIVYAILMENPNMADGQPLFHASHGNLGTAATINETSVAAALKAFTQMKGVDGSAIRLMPRYLIVPAAGPRLLEAQKLLASVTPGKSADVNPFAGAFEIVTDPRLIPTSGQDPWFLAADAAMIDTVEYAYLEGQEGVYTETRNGFEVDGTEVKARHDFTAKAIDWRGLYKNPGAAP